MQDSLRLSLEEHLTEVCGSDEAFLGDVSEDLAGGIDHDDIFSICHYYFDEVRSNLYDHLLSILSDDLYEFSRITEAEVITLCKHFFNSLVETFASRIDLCFLHFPDATYSEKSREALENTFDAIIDFDVGDLNELRDSVTLKGTTASTSPIPVHIRPPGDRPFDSSPNSPLVITPSCKPPGPIGSQPDRPPGSPHSTHSPADTSVPEQYDPSTQDKPPKEHIGDSPEPSDNTKECHKAQRQEILERRRIWNHMTISRDHTSTSDFTREFLATLFRVKTKQKDDTEDKVTIEELAVAASNIQHATIDQQRMVLDQQART
ncbi:uncharacterized protein PG998_010725 [Apiospora kogelbergensis]|uniref:uncharacterized protein n=1 Tax=Apiospora kogelbergensis TaxID=1337665 RepID=UPI00312E9651